MKSFFFIVFICFLYSCVNDGKSSEIEVLVSEVADREHLVGVGFQAILDSAKIDGSILIFDNQKKVYYSNDYNWKKHGVLPASTFKIVNSIIALETSTIENENSILKWDGQQKMFDIWEQDLLFKDAFRYSCVPCYQEIARKIGDNVMHTYLDKLGYLKMVFDSTNIDMFWLEGKSKITQMEQIDFLKNFNDDRLSISNRSKGIVKEMMLITETENYKLYGKTGWSITGSDNNGWFVGFIEDKYNTYYFATNIEPMHEFEMKNFAKTRKEITLEALKTLDIKID